ncbi:ribonuclease HII, partial [Neisseria sp. P0021.S006]
AEMYELAKRYPQYGFDRHKGYGTAQHLAALKQYGVLPEHRRDFAPVKTLLAQGNLFEE